MSGKVKASLSFTKEQWLEMSKIALVLIVIAAVVALMLSAVNEITAPRIAAQKELQVKAAMEAVLPADSYEKIENLADVCPDPVVTEAYRAIKGGECVGYCVKTAPSGFGGAIEMVVGIEAGESLKVSRAHIVSMAETPGLGTKTREAAFIDQFAGKTSGVSVGSGENQVSAVAGATVSSKAVTSGVDAALRCGELVKGAGNNG